MTDFLFETDTNQIPAATRSGMLEMRDGKLLRYMVTQAANRPLRGTVLLLHGRNESIEKYFETITDLSTRGFAVVCFDWRGQGGSSRMIRDAMRGHVNRFDDYVSDLDQVFRELVLPDCPPPFYVLAHSAGALVALLAAPLLTIRVRRMVLVAPLLGLPGSRFSTNGIRVATRTLNLIGMGRRYATKNRYQAGARPFSGNLLTSDPGRYMRNVEIVRRQPQLGLGGPTVRWVSAALHAIDRVSDPDFIAKIRIPTLVVTAGNDGVVSTPAAERFAAQLRNGALLTIDGARHEILQEADFYREQLLAAFDAFVPGSDEPDNVISTEPEETA
ncbi:alpha/beta hydrolase [Phyllobacterium salinisoli]|uniref:Alpha/beta hydrolase n=1 Tax=Phyllobacterium salinisoli TaxID=1899321 RepID=A0A368K3E7_9HYPH|nr:alpha/beta hydrolase [Phyllobacterium salinisoli]RCS23916.1 alpha/beta hydrolase [Phyllobacterium salinisoli]